jgi:hypothetical protein
MSMPAPTEPFPDRAAAGRGGRAIDTVREGPGIGRDGGVSRVAMDTSARVQRRRSVSGGVALRSVRHLRANASRMARPAADPECPANPGTSPGLRKVVASAARAEIPRIGVGARVCACWEPRGARSRIAGQLGVLLHRSAAPRAHQAGCISAPCPPQETVSDRGRPWPGGDGLPPADATCCGWPGGHGPGAGRPTIKPSRCRYSPTRLI